MNKEQEKRTPDEWEEYFGIIVLDPDGWDRSAKDWNAEWNTQITATQFKNKARESTIDVVDHDKFVRRYMIQ